MRSIVVPRPSVSDRDMTRRTTTAGVPLLAMMNANARDLRLADLPAPESVKTRSARAQVTFQGAASTDRALQLTSQRSAGYGTALQNGLLRPVPRRVRSHHQRTGIRHAQRAGAGRCLRQRRQRSIGTG